MGDEATEARALILADPGALVQSLRDELGYKVKGRWHARIWLRSGPSEWTEMGEGEI